MGVAAVGGGRKRNALGGLGVGVWASCEPSSYAAVLHLCFAQASLEVAGFFFTFLFVFLKGIVRRMLCSWQLARGVRRESSLLLVVLQIAAVKAS